MQEIPTRKLAYYGNYFFTTHLASSSKISDILTHTGWLIRDELRTGIIFYIFNEYLFLVTFQFSTQFSANLTTNVVFWTHFWVWAIIWPKFSINNELQIKLKCKNVKICKHSSFFNYWRNCLLNKSWSSNISKLVNFKL